MNEGELLAKQYIHRYLMMYLILAFTITVACVSRLTNRAENPMSFRATTILKGYRNGNPCEIEIVFKNGDIYYYTETITYNITNYTEKNLTNLKNEIEERVEEYRSFSKKNSCTKHSVEYNKDIIIETIYQDTRNKVARTDLFDENMSKVVLVKERYRYPQASYKKTIERLKTEGFVVVETIDKNNYSK